jgi:hypothetical protein
MAQHRFVALMAVWFLLSLIWTGFLWPDKDPFLYSAPVAIFVLGQVVAQYRLLGMQRNWPAPPWIKFIAAAGMSYLLFAIVEVGFWSVIWLSKRIDLRGGLSLGDLFEHVTGMLQSFLTPAIALTAWCGMFLAVFRAGWIRVPAGLIAAGLHGVASVLATISFMGSIHGKPHWPWFWMVPVGFFTGWGLLFLPGAVAAQEYVPGGGGERSLLKPPLAWLAPAAAWVIVDSATTFLFK